MNKNWYLFSCILGCSISSAFASSTSTNSGNTQSDQYCDTVSRKKKFKMGVEFGCSARFDALKVSPKKDIGTKFKNILATTNFTKLSQNELNTLTTTILTDVPALANTIKGLNKNQQNDLEAEMEALYALAFTKDTELTADDIKASVDKICNTLNITNLDQVNTWNALHDPKNLQALVIFCSAPDLIKNGVTIGELNQAMYKELTSDLDKISTFIDSNSINVEHKANDYVNWGLFAKLFVNYSLSDTFYLIGGVGFNYDLEGKGRSFLGREAKKNKKDKSSDKTSLSDNSIFLYHTKYAITPQIGIGIQCSKHFAIEFTAYDQITKAEYDCSDFYKTSIGKSFQSVMPGIETIVPNKKQSNWVNRFGVDLGFKFNITNNFFTRLGLFYTFPRNVFKKIQPIDVNIQSAGASLSLGFTF